MSHKTIQRFIPKDATIAWHDNMAVFSVSISEIAELVRTWRDDKDISLKLITATDERKADGCFKVWYVFGVSDEQTFLAPFVELRDTLAFPSIAGFCPEALNYERKIQTFFGLTAVGLPDARPLILHENWPTDIFPLRKDFEASTKPAMAKGSYPFNRVEGEGIYEIPVGPIHAGIIEPGHFRFSVAGETIMFLEPRLGFTHKGSEKLFERMSLEEMVHLSEKISGDSSFSHSLAFCQAVERLCGIEIPERAQFLRVIYAELERLANHMGDIGAIMIDTGFNFGGAQGARLRETIVRINERLTGSRFLRGVNDIGGVQRDMDKKTLKAVSRELDVIAEDFSEVIAIAGNRSSLINRLQDTGTLTRTLAKNFGVTGVAAKAVGLKRDARVDFPYAAYSALNVADVVTEESGDVYARFQVRIKEVVASIQIIKQAARKIPEGPVRVTSGAVTCPKNACSIGVVEGWRGEIVYFLTTDADGSIARVVPRDPSFLNWTVLGEVGVSNVVPDFPLINKSFNLSYSGNDL